jgi:ribosomal protein S18 acetylase RimI-like enzyme
MKTIRDGKGSFSIRPIRQDDLGAVLEVYRQCEDFLSLGPVATASMEMVLKDIELSQSQGGIFCGIYHAEGEMIGVVDFVLKDFEGDPQAAYLSLLMIAKPYRGQGLGKAVAQVVENEIRKESKVTKIMAGVQVNNPNALRFWQRQGYQITGGPARMPDQTTVYHLCKDLIIYQSKIDRTITAPC